MITVPIVILYYTPPTGVRLLIIALSTILFSSSLTIMADAARKDVFAATSAFVAVQVVFMGSA